MINVKISGSDKKLNNFFERLKETVRLGDLDGYGREGVEALRNATPVDTGETAGSWSYKIIRKNNKVRLEFDNSNRNNNVPIAIILQYGHATRNGSWVEGIDYVNPALKPIFDRIADDMWKEVKSL